KRPICNSCSARPGVRGEAHQASYRPDVRAADFRSGQEAAADRSFIQEVSDHITGLPVTEPAAGGRARSAWGPRATRRLAMDHRPKQGDDASDDPPAKSGQQAPDD